LHIIPDDVLWYEWLLLLKLPDPDSAEWHLINEQRLIAINL
jgi:hypothetical protein